MDLKDYFENRTGVGVLATSDSEGKVDAAIFARPHVLDARTVAFIMGDKTTHDNLQSNPNAAYLFKEDGDGWEGIRLFLKKTGEETDREKIDGMIRRKRYDHESGDETKYLVSFSIENTVPLVGKGSCPVEHG